MQAYSEDAWLLHTRKYTDSRILIDFLSASGSLISGVYRSARKGSGPQLFTPINVRWHGKRELKQIVGIENCVSAFSDDSPPLFTGTLSGDKLYCGLYLNELLIRLLLRDEPHPQLFDVYSQTLRDLRAEENPEPALRKFEFCLLEVLGYGVDFSHDAEGDPIDDDGLVFYDYEIERGFVRLPANSRTNLWSGELIQHLKLQEFSSPSVRRAAKLLGRRCIDQLLGGRALKSRELFRGE